MNYETKQLRLDQIEIDPELQSRESPNQSKLSEYSDLVMHSHDVFPPVDVFFDGEKYYLSDGWHRYFAYQKNFKEEINCQIYEGSKRDALLHSAAANAKHGINRTAGDKTKAVMMLLNDAEWSLWSNHKIAKHCSVDPAFVSRLRKSLVTVTSEKPSERRYINKHGQESVMNVSRIGKSKPAAETDYGDIESYLSGHESIDQNLRISEMENEIEKLRNELSLAHAEIASLKSQLRVRDDESLPF